MITPNQITSKAREYLKTPFVHQGRRKGVGIDCIGLLVGVAQELGLPIEDCTNYGEQHDGKTLLLELAAQLEPLEIESRKEGNIVCFWIKRPDKPTHVGLLTSYGLIHTYRTKGEVVETTFDAFWKTRVHSVFQYRGIEG